MHKNNQSWTYPCIVHSSPSADVSLNLPHDVWSMRPSPWIHQLTLFINCQDIQRTSFNWFQVDSPRLYPSVSLLLWRCFPVIPLSLAWGDAFCVRYPCLPLTQPRVWSPVVSVTLSTAWWTWLFCFCWLILDVGFLAQFTCRGNTFHRESGFHRT